MKKLIYALLIALIALPAFAQVMDNREYSTTIVTVATNTQTYVLRGELQAVYLDWPANKTADVSIATAEGVIFAKTAVAADAVFYPLIPAVKAADGAAATFVGGTNDTANAWYVKPVMAGPVTVTVKGAANTTGTNTFNTRLIYNR